MLEMVKSERVGACVCDFKVAVSYAGNQIKINILAVDK